MFRVNRFNALLKHFPRALFDRSVRELGADKHRKGFNSWNQLVAMLYAQLSGASSLREIEEGFNVQKASHYHLGCQPVHRSTLAEANERSDGRVFQVVAQQLMQQAQRSVRQEGVALLQLIDSTSITLKGRGFDAWTAATRTRRTQGVKLHVSYGLQEQAPIDCLLSAANVNDVAYARGRTVHKGVTYVFDKAYCDYSWWWQLTQQKARFVSRFKRNAKLLFTGERAIPRNAQGIILRDQQVLLANRSPRGGRRNPYSLPLRRIEVAREGKEPLVLVTNDHRSSALRLAALYKSRWQIELFFKWIKQHLQLRRFVGRSENAVRIQILCALIAYLLALLYAKASASCKSLWLFTSELRGTLFQRPDNERVHQRWRQQRAEFAMRQGAFLL